MVSEQNVVPKGSLWEVSSFSNDISDVVFLLVMRSCYGSFKAQLFEVGS